MADDGRNVSQPGARVGADTDETEQAVAPLSDRENAILALEKQNWRFEGAKHEAIRSRLHLSPTTYYQVLNELVDNPAALSAEPVLVRRLQRARQSRRAEVSCGP
jgi:hypothetical protein